MFYINIILYLDFGWSILLLLRQSNDGENGLRFDLGSCVNIREAENSKLMVWELKLDIYNT